MPDFVVINKATGKTAIKSGTNGLAMAEAARIANPLDGIAVRPIGPETAQAVVPLASIVAQSAPVLTLGNSVGAACSIQSATFSGAATEVETLVIVRIGTVDFVQTDITGLTFNRKAEHIIGDMRVEQRGRDSQGRWTAISASTPVSLGQIPADLDLELVKPIIAQTGGKITLASQGGLDVSGTTAVIQSQALSVLIGTATIGAQADLPLTIDPSQIGSTVFARVSGVVLIDGISMSYSIDSDPIVLATDPSIRNDPTVVVAAEITGGTAQGSKLTRKTATFDPADLTFAFFWLRIDHVLTADEVKTIEDPYAAALPPGVAVIAGEIGVSYDTVVADVGKYNARLVQGDRVVNDVVVGKARTLSNRIGPIAAAAELQPITLSIVTAAESVAEGAELATVGGKTANSTLVLTSDASGRFALNTDRTKLLRGLRPLDFETATLQSSGVFGYRLEFSETPPGGGAARSTIIDFAVTDVVEGYPTANLVQQGNIAFSWTGAARVVAHSWDGSCVVVVPDGTTISMSEPTPAAFGSGAAFRNGAMLNPRRNLSSTDLNNLLAFDGRHTGNFDAGKIPIWPAIMGDGDILIKAISEPTVITNRGGLYREGAVCHVINETKFAALGHDVADMLSPAPFGWSGRTTKVWRYVDEDAVMSLRPKLAAPSPESRPTTLDALHTRLDKFNPFQNLATNSNHNSSGYEMTGPYAYGLPVPETGTPALNYGAYMGDAIGTFALDWMSTTADSIVLPVTKRLIAHGSWLFDIEEGQDTTGVVDGAHYQWSNYGLPVGLIATGRSNRIPDLKTISPQNPLKQPIILTAAQIALCVPHDLATSPHTWRKRAISISGSTITLTGGNLSGDPYHLNFGGMQIRRASDNALIGVSQQTSTNMNKDNGYVFTASSVSGLTNSDQIYFTPVRAIAAGDAVWAIKGDEEIAAFNPGVNSPYSDIQNWTPYSLWVRALGIWSTTTFGAMEKVVIDHNDGTDGYPDMHGYSKGNAATGPNGSDTWTKQCWNAWKTKLSVGVVPVAGSVTLIDDIVADSKLLANEVYVFHGGAGVDDTGTEIEYRVVGGAGTVVEIAFDDDLYSGLYSIAPSVLGTIPASGVLTATKKVPRTPGRMQAKVRAQGTTTWITQTRKFAVGYAFSWWTQSEGGHVSKPPNNNSAAGQTVDYPGRVQIWYTVNQTDVTITPARKCEVVRNTEGSVSGTNSRNAAYSHIANQLTDHRDANGNPYFWKVVHHYKHGVGQQDAFSDTTSEWNFKRDTQTLHDEAFSAKCVGYNGKDVPDLAFQYWLSATRKAPNLHENMLKWLSRKKKDGSFVTYGNTINLLEESKGSENVTLDDSFARLYGDTWPRTRWGLTKLIGARVSAAYHNDECEDMRAARTDARAFMFRSPEGQGAALARAPGPVAHYQDLIFGTATGSSSGPGDFGHPGWAAQFATGTARMGRSMAFVAQWILGAIKAPVPIIDNVLWAAGGLRMRSSVGPFTTERLQADGVNSTPAIAGRVVREFFVNGATVATEIRDPVSGAKAAEGDLWLLPADGQSFSGSDTFAWTTGVATDLAQSDATFYTKEPWKDTIIVKHAAVDRKGGLRFSGLPIDSRATPSSILANKIGATAVQPVLSLPTAKALGATGMEGTVTTTVSGTLYRRNRTGATVSTEAQMVAAASVASSGVGVVSSKATSGLTAGSAYYTDYMLEGPTGLRSAIVTSAAFVAGGGTVITPPADTTAPVLSAPTDNANGATGGLGTVSTDEGAGTLYVAATAGLSSTAPSAAQIIAGTGGGIVFANSKAVTAAGSQSLGVTGQASGTAYRLHFVQVDAAATPNTSNVVSGDGYTTATVDNTAPTLSAPTDDANGSTGMTGTVSTNEGNGKLYSRRRTGATVSTQAQLLATTGQDVTASGVQNVTGTGLTAATAYVTDYLHVDAAGNASGIVSADGFTTAAAGAISPFVTAANVALADPNNPGAGVTAVRFKAKVRVPATAAFTSGSGKTIFWQGGAGIQILLQRNASGAASIYPLLLEDGLGNSLALTGSSSQSLVQDAALSVVEWKIDFEAGTIVSNKDGTNVKTSTFPVPTAAYLQPNQKLVALSNAATSGSGMMPAGYEFEYIEVYFTKDGAETLRARIEGPATSANAHPWKAGTGSFT